MKPDYNALPEHIHNMLAYMVHSKDHVLNKNQRCQGLDDAIAVCGQPVTLPLYRGVKGEELSQLTAGSIITAYQSFSESYDVARQFGTVIEVIGLPRSLNYGRYQIAQLDKLTNDDYVACDGDFLKRVAAEECEWIAPFGLRYKLIGAGRYKFLFETIKG